MKLKQFIDKYPSLGAITMDHIAIEHPDTGEKIYIISHWNNGFWYKKTKGSASEDGTVWPMQYSGDLLNLKVHKDSKKELF